MPQYALRVRKSQARHQSLATKLKVLNLQKNRSFGAVVWQVSMMETKATELLFDDEFSLSGSEINEEESEGAELQSVEDLVVKEPLEILSRGTVGDK